MKRLVVLAAALALSGSSAQALRLPAAPRCSICPKTNAWNMRVDTLPVAANSAAIIESIGTSAVLHADFGSGLYDGGVIGIPFDVVTKKTPRTTRITFEYSDESDHVAYPIPKNVHIESGSDHHALLLDKDGCRLYELGGLARSGGRWTAWAGATWNLRSNKVRPADWTSADAAGLPIFPASRATTRSSAASSTTRFASPCSDRAARTSIPHATTRRASPTRACRRWDCVSA